MPASKPILNPRLVVAEIDGEKVVYDRVHAQLHYLNHSASLVTDLCDGETTIRQMAEAIADVYEMPFDDVRSQVNGVVRDLRKVGVIEERTGAISPDTADDDLDLEGLVRMEVPRNA
jgi:hypothetical protein